MRVAIYCQVITGGQNCNRQERDLFDYVTKCGYEVVGVWNKSGSGAKLDRAKRKEVVAIAHAREIDAVLVNLATVAAKLQVLPKSRSGASSKRSRDIGNDPIEFEIAGKTIQKKGPGFNAVYSLAISNLNKL